MNFGLEAKVGVFVVAATLMLAAMGIIFGKLNITREKGYDIRFEILDASGINTNVPVFFRGVKVGFVKSVDLKGDDLIATLQIGSEYKLPDNAIFAVRQAGFVGEKFVELVRNDSLPAVGYLEPGKIYDGKQTIASMDVIMAKVDNVAEQIGTLVKSLNEVFSNKDSINSLNASIKSLESITANVDKIVSTNDEKFNEIVENARNLTAVLTRVIENNEKNVDKSLNNIAELTKSLKSFSASIDTITKENAENIDASLKNIKVLTDKLNTTMTDVNKISKDLADGNGTLGMLINDNQTKEDIKSVVTNVKSMVSRVSDYKLYVTFGADYLFDANDARGYANVRLYTSKNTFYMLGVSNTPQIDPTTTTTRYKLVTSPGNGGIIPDGTIEFESVKDEYKSSKLAFSLQYGHIFYDIIGMRVGIFDSTLGVAGDIYPLSNENLAISFEAYDFGAFDGGFEVYTRAYARWHFFRNFFVQAGVEDVLNNRNRVYTVGGGVRFADEDLKYFAGSLGSVAK